MSDQEQDNQSEQQLAKEIAELRQAITQLREEMGRVRGQVRRERGDGKDEDDLAAGVKTIEGQVVSMAQSLRTLVEGLSEGIQGIISAIEESRK